MSGFTTGVIPLGTRVKADDPSYDRQREHLGHRWLGKKGSGYQFVEVAVAVADPYLAAAGGKCLRFTNREAYTSQEGAGGEDFAGVVPPARTEDEAWFNGLEIGDLLYVQVTGRATCIDAAGGLANSASVTMGATGGVAADAANLVNTEIGVVAQAAPAGAGEPVKVDLNGLRF